MGAPRPRLRRSPSSCKTSSDPRPTIVPCRFRSSRRCHGAASGIGRAMARASPRRLVDRVRRRSGRRGAAAVAEEIGGVGIGIDVADEAAIVALTRSNATTARSTSGGNAGIVANGGVNWATTSGTQLERQRARSREGLPLRPPVDPTRLRPPSSPHPQQACSPTWAPPRTPSRIRCGCARPGGSQSRTAMQASVSRACARREFARQ